MTDYEINTKVYEVESDLDNFIIKVDVDNNDDGAFVEGWPK